MELARSYELLLGNLATTLAYGGPYESILLFISIRHAPLSLVTITITIVATFLYKIDLHENMSSTGFHYVGDPPIAVNLN